jgi:glycosyltransferase involved in cell wall biosynthesis
MHVLITTITNGFGGREMHTVGLVNALAAAGHGVSLLSINHHHYEAQRNLMAPSVEMHHRAVSKKIRHVCFDEWQQLFHGLRADVAILQKGSIHVGTWSLERALRSRCGRLIAIVHETPAPLLQTQNRVHNSEPGGRLDPLRRYLAEISRGLVPDMTICVNNVTRDWLIKHRFYSPARTTTVHNGIDVTRFTPSADVRRQWRRAHGMSETAILFGMLGRLVTIKQPCVALRQFAALVQRRPDLDARLVFIGDGPEREPLEREAVLRGLAAQVRFTGFLSDPVDMLRSLDFLLMPSWGEALPLSLLEGMATGVVPIAYAVGGIPEVLRDGREGWLIRPGDEEGFGRQMEAAAQLDVGRRAEMSRACRDRVVDAFNARKQYALLVDIIEQVAARVPSRRVVLSGC